MAVSGGIRSHKVCQLGTLPQTLAGCFLQRYAALLGLALVAAGPTLGLCAQAPGNAARLEARIVDDATGAPLAARVAVTNADGKFLEIEGQH